VVSANSIALSKEEEAVDSVLDRNLRLDVGGPGSATVEASSGASRAGVLGVTGLIVVVVILSLGAYFIVRYLL
jgi:hypothetical protein